MNAEIEIKEFVTYLDTPLGEMEIVADENALLSLEFVETKAGKRPKKEIHSNALTRIVCEQLRMYFEGKLKDFDLPLNLRGTDFQNSVWMELRNIAFGKTISYLDLAKKLGDEKCIRAAASANGKNPFAIIIPCHRVIGSNGSLTGYAGDLWRKQWLLEHEEKACGRFSKLF